MAAPDPFFESIAPLRDALGLLVDAAGAARDQHGMFPHDGSRGMKELAEEPKYAGAWSNTPVMNAYSIAMMRLVAADDHIRSLNKLLTDDPVPTYSHTVLARSALEAVAGSAWMTELAIGVQVRVGRYATDRVADKRARATLIELLGGEYIEKAKELRTEAANIYKETEKLGLKVLRNKKDEPIGIEEQRPGRTQLVASHIARLRTHSDTGEVVYRLFSGIAHSESHGLNEGFDAVEDVSFPEGMASAQFRTTADAVAATLGTVTLAYLSAVEQLAELYGWDDPEWEQTRIQALQVGRDRFPKE